MTQNRDSLCYLVEMIGMMVVVYIFKVSREAVKMETDSAVCMQQEIRANGTSTFSNGRNFPVRDSLAAEPVQAVVLGEPPITANIEYDVSDQNINHPRKLQEQ